MKNNKLYDAARRKFVHDLGVAAISMCILPHCSGTAGKESSTDRIKKAKAAGKLGIALVGLGNYAGGQLAPALQQTKHCYLAGIVTGTPSKESQWKNKYSLSESNIYNYQTFDRIKDNPDIDIIYVVLPNS